MIVVGGRWPLLLLFFPVIELFVSIAAVRNYGFGNAFFAWLVGTILGIGLFRSSSFRLTTGVAQAMQRGESPGLAALDSALVGLAGLLFLFPGFVSDGVAILLLVPFVRRWVAWRFIRYFEAKQGVRSGPRAAPRQAQTPNSETDSAANAVIDVDAKVID